MSAIAPLDYERWAVLVNPFPAPNHPHGETKAPQRLAEQLSSVNAGLGGAGSRASGGLTDPFSRVMGLGGETPEGEPVRPLIGPHPADLNWFFQLPGGVQESIQDRPAIGPQKLVELYEPPENARARALRLSV